MMDWHAWKTWLQGMRGYVEAGLNKALTRQEELLQARVLEQKTW